MSNMFYQIFLVLILGFVSGRANPVPEFQNDVLPFNQCLQEAERTCGSLPARLDQGASLTDCCRAFNFTDCMDRAIKDKCPNDQEAKNYLIKVIDQQTQIEQNFCGQFVPLRDQCRTHYRPTGTDPKSSNDEDNGGLGTWAIVGIVIGGLVLLSLVATLIAYFCKRG